MSAKAQTIDKKAEKSTTQLPEPVERLIRMEGVRFGLIDGRKMISQEIAERTKDEREQIKGLNKDLKENGRVFLDGKDFGEILEARKALSELITEKKRVKAEMDIKAKDLTDKRSAVSSAIKDLDSVYLRRQYEAITGSKITPLTAVPKDLLGLMKKDKAADKAAAA
jgi:uncharacterized protein YqgV (UPF0045/DUF77 family)